MREAKIQWNNKDREENLRVEAKMQWNSNDRVEKLRLDTVQKTWQWVEVSRRDSKLKLETSMVRFMDAQGEVRTVHAMEVPVTLGDQMREEEIMEKVIIEHVPEWEKEVVRGLLEMQQGKKVDTIGLLEMQ